jgi:Ca2+-dependent lipid-binding protein
MQAVEVMELQIFDNDLPPKKDELIGLVSIKLDEVTKQKTTESWYKIEGKKAQQAQLYVMIEYEEKKTEDGAQSSGGTIIFLVMFLIIFTN